METRELKINVPEGYEIDKEKSTFENIVFKKKEEKIWRDDKRATMGGYYIGVDGSIVSVSAVYNREPNYNVFATRKQAKSALAMARISQIMVNDERFGGPVTDEELANSSKLKYCIDRKGNKIIKNQYWEYTVFLAFHTPEQRELFLKENEDLVKDYLMID